MAVAYVGKGAFNSALSGSSPMSVAQRAGVTQGNFLLLLVNTGNQPVSAPSGWTQVANSPSGQGTAGAATSATSIQAFYKFAGAAEGSASVAFTGSYAAGIILEFSGVDTTTPINITAASQQTTGATAWTLPGVTTTVGNAMVVLALGLDNDAASTAQLSAFTNANLASLTERHDQTVTTGVGGGIGAATGTKATAGATGTTAVTSAASTTASFLTIALNPSVPAKISTLTDDFASLDSAKWTAQTNVTVSGGTANFVNTSAYPTLQSVNRYDFTDSTAFVQLVSLPTSTGTDVYFEVRLDASNGYFFNFDPNNINCYYRLGGTSTLVGSTAYNPATHKYFRLRHDTAAGLVYYDVSADGSSWTNLRSTTVKAFAIDSCLVVIDAGNWNATTTDVTSFDNFNGTGGSTETITTDNASLALTGQTVTPTDLEVVGNASLTLTGQTVNVGDTEPITVTNAALALNGQTVTPADSELIAVSNAPLALNGQTVTPTDLEAVSTASLALTGQTIAVADSELIPAGNAALALSGQTVTPTDLEALSSGSLTLTGQTVTPTDLEGVSPASLALTGQGVGVVDSEVIAPASLSLTGQPITIPDQTTEAITVDPGSLSLSGQNVLEAETAPVAPASLTLTGQDVATPADTAPGTEAITVDTGLLGLTGQGLTVSDIVILDPSARTAAGGGGAGEGKRKLDLERKAEREARQRLLDDAVEQSYPGVRKPAPAAPQPILDDDEDDEELLLLIG